MVTDTYVYDRRGYCYLDAEGVWNGEYLDKVPSGKKVSK